MDWNTNKQLQNETNEHAQTTRNKTLKMNPQPSRGTQTKQHTKTKQQRNDTNAITPQQKNENGTKHTRENEIRHKNKTKTSTRNAIRSNSPDLYSNSGRRS